MLDVMQQRRGYTASRRGHENRGTRHARRAIRRRFDKDFHRHRAFGHAFTHQGTATRPCGQQREDDETDNQREIAAIGHLQKIRTEIRHIDGDKNRENRQRFPFGPFPQLEQHDREQAGINEHRAGHRDTISSGQIA